MVMVYYKPPIHLQTYSRHDQGYIPAPHHVVKFMARCVIMTAVVTTTHCLDNCMVKCDEQSILRGPPCFFLRSCSIWVA